MMALQGESVAHAELVGSGQTSKHSHSGGGGGADIKSGSAVGTASSWTSVTFNTPFASTPSVAFVYETPSVQDLKKFFVRNITTTGFEFYYTIRDNYELTAHWIATDAGNP